MEDKTRCTWFTAVVTPDTIVVRLAKRDPHSCVPACAVVDALERETRYYDEEDGALLCVDQWGEWEVRWLEERRTPEGEVEWESCWTIPIDDVEGIAVYLRELRDARVERDPGRNDPPRVIRTGAGDSAPREETTQCTCRQT